MNHLQFQLGIRSELNGPTNRIRVKTSLTKP